MEKILVTTDQSMNSRAAIRFAINLANARKADLIVLNVYELMQPYTWTPDEFDLYRQDFEKKTKARITALVNKIAKPLKCPGAGFEVALVNNINVTDGIIQFTEKVHCSYLCIATRGAGFVGKIFGTHTSQLIARSNVPVISVPSGYRSKALHKVLYATDMTDYEPEMLQVLDFVRPLGAGLATVHVAAVDGQKPDGTYIEKTIRKKFKYRINLFNREWDMPGAILKGIREEAIRYKPSAIVFFTHQSRPILAKLLLPSNAAELSFYSKIPIISFRKR